MALFKKEKLEKVALDFENNANQRIAIKAALEYKIPMISIGSGVYLLDLGRTKDDQIHKFLKQIITQSETRIKGAIFREDPRCDYLVIYD